MTLPKVYAILDPAVAANAAEAAEALLEAGVRLIQFREKRHFGRDAFALAERIAAACREAGAQFVVNDRADVALLLEAGVHVGQDDLPPSDARRIVGPRLLGFSTHNEAQFRAALREPVDYVALGPIFPTTTKANPDPVVGLEELARLAAAAAKPVVAIGGIQRETARQVWSAGAAAIALCADLFPRGATKSGIRERAAEWLTL